MIRKCLVQPRNDGMNRSMTVHKRKLIRPQEVVSETRLMEPLTSVPVCLKVLFSFVEDRLEFLGHRTACNTHFPLRTILKRKGKPKTSRRRIYANLIFFCLSKRVHILMSLRRKPELCSVYHNFRLTTLSITMYLL